MLVLGCCACGTSPLLAGKSVVVLEARTVGGGNSGKGLGLVSTWTTGACVGRRGGGCMRGA